MIGFHMQNTVPDWLEAVAQLPPGTPVKAVNDYFMCRDVKRVNGACKTVFRHVADGEQHPSDNYDDNIAKARHFFSTFIDGTWWQQEIWRYVDYIEEWNEYLANSMPDDEIPRWLSWNHAVQTVWEEYKVNYPELSNIRLVCCNTAVGNSIPVQFASQTAQFGNVLGYHNYVHYEDGERDPLDWTYHSGRWTGMDALYQAQGVTVDWLFTEGGPYYDVFAGWKDSRVLGGDLERYKRECIAYQIDKMSAWNLVNDGRCLGGVLFTSSNDDGWVKYNLDGGQLKVLADFIAIYTPDIPPPIDPPPVDDWQRRAWDKSVEMQISNGIMLNANAGIQRRIFEDGNMNPGAFVPVQNEFSFEGRTFQAAETLDNSQPRRLYWWTAVDGVNWFEEPEP